MSRAQLYLPQASDWINAFEAGRAQRERSEQRKLEQQRTEAGQKIGQQISAKDYTGAAATAYGTGDWRTGTAIGQMGQDSQKAEREQLVQRVTTVAKTLRAARQTQGGLGVLKAFDDAAKVGLIDGDPQTLQQYREQILNDPDGFLSSLEGEARKLTPVNLGSGGFGFADSEAGTLDVLREPQRAAGNPQLVEQYDPSTGQTYKTWAFPPASPEEAQPMPQAPASPPQGVAPVSDIRGAVESMIPGVRVTSQTRTPERNRAVGGSPRSYHLTGNALDLVPPPGMSMAQLEQRIRSAGLPLAELINEGDHIHVAWRPQALEGGAGADQLVGGSDGSPDAVSALLGAPAAPVAAPAPRQAQAPAQQRFIQPPKAPDRNFEYRQQRDGLSDQRYASEQAAKAAEAKAKADAIAKTTKARDESLKTRASGVVEMIDRVLGKDDGKNAKGVGWGEAGFIGKTASGVAGTRAYDVDRLLDTIKANIGFAELSKMRSESPTGGALGQVTERELAFLQSVEGSLDIGQSEKQLESQLRRLRMIYKKLSGSGPAGSAKPAGPSVTPPKAAIGYLKQNPKLAAQFDAKYGEGASKRYLGQ